MADRNWCIGDLKFSQRCWWRLLEHGAVQLGMWVPMFRNSLMLPPSGWPKKGQSLRGSTLLKLPWRTPLKRRYKYTKLSRVILHKIKIFIYKNVASSKFLSRFPLSSFRLLLMQCLKMSSEFSFLSSAFVSLPIMICISLSTLKQLKHIQQVQAATEIP